MGWGRFSSSMVDEKRGGTLTDVTLDVIGSTVGVRVFAVYFRNLIFTKNGELPLEHLDFFPFQGLLRLTLERITVLLQCSE